MKRPKRMLEDLDRDIREHIETETRDNIDRGMSPEEARYAAMRKFGNVARVKEEAREVWSFVRLEQFWQDIRYGLRMLRKAPGFTAVAVVTLALGIGANTAVFSMVDSFLLRPLPVDQPSQLVVLAFQHKSGALDNQLSYPNIQDIQSQAAGAFSSVLGYDIGLDSLRVNGNGERLLTSYVTGNFFPSLGLKPYMGRLILPSEGAVPDADPVVVLSYSYWKSRFGGDLNVIGQKVSINARPFTIVGVGPPGFHGLHPLLDVQGYIPYGMLAVSGRESGFMSDRARASAFTLARLRPGVALKQAQTELDVVSERLSAEYPKVDEGIRFSAHSELLSRPDPDSGGQIVQVGTIFLVLTLLVLLLACVNVANFLLIRATGRRREMAVRVALGAPRNRLVRQLLTESVLLAVLGGVAGIILGVWCSAAIAGVNLKTAIPTHLDFGLDWRVFLFTLGVALFAGVIVGLIPALRASRADVNQVLHEGGRGIVSGRHRLRDTLVIVQVGGSLALLVIAALFTRSLKAVQQTNFGFDPAHVVNLSMDPKNLGYDDASSLAFYRNLLDRVRALPGVQSASIAFAVPCSYYSSSGTLDIEGYEPPKGQPAPNIKDNKISTDYFQTMRIPILHGRDFTSADDENSKSVVIISETMANQFWPQQNPIGRKFKSTDAKRVGPLEIIGVAKDARFSGLSGTIDPYFYVPLAQSVPPFVTLQVRTAAGTDSLLPALKSQVALLAPGLPLFDVQSMDDALDTMNGLLLFQFGAVLSGAIGFLGLTLAVVGVYGVVSYSAGQRTHEIGVRMALGAQPGDVLHLILRQGFIIVIAGVLAGLLLAFGVAHTLGDALVGVSPTDPLTYASVSLLLTCVALLACWIPVRRAMRVDPMVALRYE
jgi:putative ABC transport system permease protein